MKEESNFDPEGCGIFVGIICVSLAVGSLHGSEYGWMTCGLALIIVPIIERLLRQ